MSALTLADASLIVDGALAHARSQGMRPLCVVVLDAGGWVVALKREDRASLFRPQMAEAKARAVLGIGIGGRALMARAQASPAFYQALSHIDDCVILPAPGAVIIRDAAGEIVGSVGITGDTGDNDEACALAGIAATGLTGEV